MSLSYSIKRRAPSRAFSEKAVADGLQRNLKHLAEYEIDPSAPPPCGVRRRMECTANLRLRPESFPRGILPLGRFCAAIVAILFLFAELWRPTLPHSKANATSSLIVAIENQEAAGSETRLGPALLDDLPRLDMFPIGNVDAVISGKQRVAPLRKWEFPVAAQASVRIVGWFADSQSRTPAAAIFPIIDGERRADADLAYGFVRPDVGRLYGTPALDPTGFALRIPAGTLRRGRHTVSFGVVSNDRRGFFLAPEALILDASR